MLLVIVTGLKRNQSPKYDCLKPPVGEVISITGDFPIGNLRFYLALYVSETDPLAGRQSGVPVFKNHNRIYRNEFYAIEIKNLT